MPNNPPSQISTTSFPLFAPGEQVGCTRQPIQFGGKFWAPINNGSVSGSKLAVNVSTDEINWTEADAGNGPDPGYPDGSTGAVTVPLFIYPGSGSRIYCVITSDAVSGVAPMTLTWFDMAGN